MFRVKRTRLGWSVRVPETSMDMSGLQSPVLVSVDDCCLLSDITHPSRIVTGNIVLRGNRGKCSANVIATETSCSWTVAEYACVEFWLCISHAFSTQKRLQNIGLAAFFNLLESEFVEVYGWLPLWSSGQSFWLQMQRSRVRFPAPPDFLSSSGSGTGSTQPREVNWGATWIKSSGSGLENGD